MFVSPVFLIAAGLGATIPLILHLMQNQRREQMPFPTLRFLKLADQKSSRRIKIENFLLWLLRTLIMALLGIAFAMPILRSQGVGWLGDTPRDVGIVIDASYSMGYDLGRQTVWDRAIAEAKALIQGLGDNDRFCVFLAREQPEALFGAPIGDKETAVKRLEALEPGSGSSQLAPAVTETIKALNKEGPNREHEIFILTDNQALPWQSFGSVAEAVAGEGGENPTAAGVNADWDPTIAKDDAAVFVVMLGVTAPENVGPDSIELFPALVRRGANARATASLLRSGLASESAATLFVNDEQSGRRPVRFDSPDDAVPAFPLPSLPPGVHAGRIETPTDNLLIDNAFHFLIRVEDRSPALCVGSRDDTLFVKTALETGAGGEDGGGEVEVISPDEVDGFGLEDYACIFLCNALPMSGQGMIALEGYVRQGGLLVVFPGTRANPDAYRPWTFLPALPEEVTETARNERGRTLSWPAPQHALVRPLREGVSVPVLTIRRHLQWGELPEYAEQLLSMGQNQPFLIERVFGDGRVLMFAIAADRTWSEFPLSPFFLPMVQQCVDYSAGFGGRLPFLWSSDSLSLTDRIPGVTRDAKLRAPDGSLVPIRSSVQDGRTSLVAEGVQQPGIYEISTPAKPLPVPALAVNLPRRESDLTPLAAEDAVKRLGLEHVFVSTGGEELQQIIQEQRVGRTYGEHLLWLAFLLVVIEFFYANALVKSGPRLSDQLKVDSAGHMRGHVGEVKAVGAK